MDVEGSGDLTDGLSLIDEFADEFLLIRSHFGRAPKRHPSFSCVDNAILGVDLPWKSGEPSS